MAALEQASAGQDIAPFADLLAGLVEDGIEGRLVAKVPNENQARRQRAPAFGDPAQRKRQRTD